MSPGMAQELEHNDKLPYMLRTMGDTCSCGPQKHSLRKATHARTHVAGTRQEKLCGGPFSSCAKTCSRKLQRPSSYALLL